MDKWQEHCDFTYSTDVEWDRAAASEQGAAHPDRAWVLTDRDVWYKNPYYQGPPVPHPEDYDAEADAAPIVDQPVVAFVPYDEDMPF